MSTSNPLIPNDLGGGPKLPQHCSGLVVALLYGLGQRRDEVVVEVGAHA